MGGGVYYQGPLDGSRCPSSAGCAPLDFDLTKNFAALDRTNDRIVT